MSRRRAEASSSSAPAAKARRIAALEPIVDAINAGRNPKAMHHGAVVELMAATPSTFISTGSGVAVGDGEARCYLLAEVNDIALFLPKSIVRELNCTLMSWELLKLVPPEWYVIVFKDRATGRYRAVPESKLAVDGYPPAVTKANDPEHAAGFTNKKELRLVLYPNAFRFFWGGTHETLKTIWPTARQIMSRGYVLPVEARRALDARIDAVASAGGEKAWCATFRQVLRDRHWGPSVSDPIESLDRSAPQLRALELESPTGAMRVLEACAPAVSLAARAIAKAADLPGLREVEEVPPVIAKTTGAAHQIHEAVAMKVFSALPPDVLLPGVMRPYEDPGEMFKRFEAFEDQNGEGDPPLQTWEYPCYVASSAVARGANKRARPEQIGYTQIRMPDGSIREFDSPRFPTDRPGSVYCSPLHMWCVVGTGLDPESECIHAEGVPHCSLRWSREDDDSPWRASFDLRQCSQCGDQSHLDARVFARVFACDDCFREDPRLSYTQDDLVVVELGPRWRRRQHEWVCCECEPGVRCGSSGQSLKDSATTQRVTGVAAPPESWHAEWQWYYDNGSSMIVTESSPALPLS